MAALISTREPVIFRVGAKYLLKVKKNDPPQIEYKDVSFISYMSSPEDIVVKTNTGMTLKVSRSDVYEMK